MDQIQIKEDSNRQLYIMDLQQQFDQFKSADGTISIEGIINICLSQKIDGKVIEQIKEECEQLRLQKLKEHILYDDLIKLMRLFVPIKDLINEQNQITIEFFDNHSLLFFDNKQRSIRKLILDKKHDQIEILKIRCKLPYGLNIDENLQQIIKHPQYFDFRYYTPDLWRWIQSAKTNTKKNLTGIFYNLQSRKDENESEFKLFDHRIYESEERGVGLEICGWACNISNKTQLPTICENLIKNGEFLRAVMISVFHFDFTKALSILKRLNHQDDSINLLKSILVGMSNIQEYLKTDKELKAIFYQQNQDKNFDQMADELDQDSYQTNLTKMSDLNSFHFLEEDGNLKQLRMISQIELRQSILKEYISFLQKLCKEAKFSQPYITFICEFIAENNYTKIIFEKSITVFDRIAFALRFCNYNTLNEFLKHQIEKAEAEGILDMIILVGKANKHALNIVQSFINKTSDLQTAGLISFHLKLLGFHYQEFDDFYENYRQLLNRLVLYEARQNLDKEIHDIDKTFSEQHQQNDFFESMRQHQHDTFETMRQEFSDSSQVLICNSCKKSLNHQSLIEDLRQNAKKKIQISSNFDFCKSLKISVCTNCSKSTPICSICLIPLQIFNPMLEFREGKPSKLKPEISSELNLDESICWCQNCMHGGHFKHYMDWFSEYTVCPVSDCSCECSLL